MENNVGIGYIGRPLKLVLSGKNHGERIANIGKVAGRHERKRSGGDVVQSTISTREQR
jgi:hypothetical protein